MAYSYKAFNISSFLEPAGKMTIITAKQQNKTTYKLEKIVPFCIYVNMFKVKIFNYLI